MTRVLLTGANGFIGRHVTDALIARGHDVHAVSRQHQGQDESGAQPTWHNLDLYDSVALEKLLADLRATHLVHLAWITEPGEYWQSPQNESWRNASVSLLNDFARHGGKRALIAGTCAEYDWSDGLCVEDKTPTRARSPYTESKRALHDEAATIAQATGLGVGWARIFFPFGPHERPERLLPSVIRALLAGERAACSDGEQVRDYLYVRDVASAMVSVLDHDFCGDINIASGIPLALKDLVNLVADKLDARDRVDFGSRPRQDNEPPRIVADVTRLKEIIGWTPGYQLETAIDETIAWWRASLG